MQRNVTYFTLFPPGRSVTTISPAAGRIAPIAPASIASTARRDRVTLPVARRRHPRQRVLRQSSKRNHQIRHQRIRRKPADRKGRRRPASQQCRGPAEPPTKWPRRGRRICRAFVGKRLSRRCAPVSASSHRCASKAKRQVAVPGPDGSDSFGLDARRPRRRYTVIPKCTLANENSR